MIVYSGGLYKNNVSILLKHVLRFHEHLLPRRDYVVKSFQKMSHKVDRNKTYVAVNINGPGAAENLNQRKNIFAIFRRKKTSNNVTKKEPTLNKSELKRLFSLAKPEKWRLACAICFLFISSSVTMAVPFSLGKVLDIIYTIAEDTQQRLNKVCGVLLCIFVLGAICNFGRVYFMSVAGYRMTQALRTKVFNAILKQEQGWFDKRPTGELINRLSSDTQIVGQALSQNISDGLRSTVMVFVGTGMMFYMSPQLALVGLAIVPPVAGVAVVYGRYVRGISRRLQDSLAEATKVAEEKISNMRTVKAFAQEPREMDAYLHSIKNVLNLGYLEAKARAIFYGMTGFSGHVIIISVLYYGGVMVSSHEITVGNLSSFLLYAAYIGVSVGGLSSFYTELNRSLGAATRIWEIIDRPPTIAVSGGFTPMSEPDGHIEYKNIKFSYPSREDIEILNNFDLNIVPGKMVAVVGPSGSGKSTLAALLLRLYDPDNGAIYLDGHNIKDLDPSWLRKHIGTVSQEPILFSCSIKDNILYGADDPEEVTEDELIKVAKEANVYEFVQQLPDGFNTVVGERGVMLSGGQKQRVAIARALIKNPKILLLDEATSALDAQSERLVQEALERVMKGRTVLTIAHRLSTIQNADTIAVLKNGQIIEQGNYQQLLNRENGAFKELMKHQTFES
ncbi:ATP-binding cassette sub-family B member 10, mitochondrial isoform X1 [Cylas formicarius]|uniref:ATP-binding cassette sub-family B member 10, mitochondrial isoform X1 n=3 Tax=Cylas formicarius TaxID=197179 RepID=UPI0029589C73|nr:ATP-binding cassette sub-family B member 10, mitochondrial isoform X1 [Cylas formicarius]